MYKGHMDKANRGKDRGWEVGMVVAVGSSAGKMETNLLEQQSNKFNKIEERQIFQIREPSEFTGSMMGLKY